MKKLVYFVDHGIMGIYFDTYEQAELFCGENGIHPENIYEEEESEKSELGNWGEA